VGGEHQSRKTSNQIANPRDMAFEYKFDNKCALACLPKAATLDSDEAVRRQQG
jgi:hypothetical protein